jgi:hypothetical protein
VDKVQISYLQGVHREIVDEVSEEGAIAHAADDGEGVFTIFRSHVVEQSTMMEASDVSFSPINRAYIFPFRSS